MMKVLVNFEKKKLMIFFASISIKTISLMKILYILPKILQSIILINRQFKLIRIKKNCLFISSLSIRTILWLVGRKIQEQIYVCMGHISYT